jgi:hypothetical protein
MLGARWLGKLFERLIIRDGKIIEYVPRPDRTAQVIPLVDNYPLSRAVNASHYPTSVMSGSDQMSTVKKTARFAKSRSDHPESDPRARYSKDRRSKP